VNTMEWECEVQHKSFYAESTPNDEAGYLKRPIHYLHSLYLEK
jgi:hypothetical protein